MTKRDGTGNIFSDGAVPSGGESFFEILRLRNVLVETIRTAVADPEKEYRQEQDEWVVVVEGRATLEMEGRTVTLGRGDHLFIPAGAAHRVLEADRGTLWLAVHVYPEPTCPGS